MRATLPGRGGDSTVPASHVRLKARTHVAVKATPNRLLLLLRKYPASNTDTASPASRVNTNEREYYTKTQRHGVWLSDLKTTYCHSYKHRHDTMRSPCLHVTVGVWSFRVATRRFSKRSNSSFLTSCSSERGSIRCSRTHSSQDFYPFSIALEANHFRSGRSR